MKFIIATFVLFYSLIANSAQGLDAIENFVKDDPVLKKEYSKTFICIAAAETAIDAFELKQSRRKLVYHKTDDLISAIIVKQSMDIGYKAKSEKEAARISFDKCVNSNIWNETSKKM